MTNIIDKHVAELIKKRTNPQIISIRNEKEVINTGTLIFKNVREYSCGLRVT